MELMFLELLGYNILLLHHAGMDLRYINKYI